MMAPAGGDVQEIALLNELANLRLQEGDVDGAKQLFTQVAQKQKAQLGSAAAAAAAAAPGPSSHDVTTTGGDSQAGDDDDDNDDDWESNWGGAAAAAAPVADVPSSSKPAPGPATRPQPTASTSTTSTTGKLRSSAQAATATVWDEIEAGAGQRAAAGSTSGTRQTSETGASSRGTSRSQGPSILDADEDSASDAGPAWEGGFDHCVEVFGLTVDVKTGDLQEFLDIVMPRVKLQPRIKWSDDAHAVFVCDSVSTAKLLMARSAAEGLQLRLFSEASEATRQLPVSELLPPKPRPKTTTAVAKRLLSHALGNAQLRDRKAEQELAAQRKAAKDIRQAERVARTAAWDE